LRDLRKVMLNNNNNKNDSACRFAEQIVPYLYNEATAVERSEFETHLDKCSICDDELDGFSFVRNSISEWRSDEIFALEMPAFDIQVMRTAKTSKILTVEAEQNTWFAQIRRFFVFSPKFVFGFGAVVVVTACIAATLVFLNSLGNNEIAENTNQGSQKVSNTKVDVKNEEVFPEQISITKQTEVSPLKVKMEKAQFNSPKISDNSNNMRKIKTVVQKSNNTIASTGNEIKKNKVNSLEKQEAPTLYKSAEDEDKSLRLADLFAEIGTK
jgi:hypothetical protein